MLLLHYSDASFLLLQLLNLLDVVIAESKSNAADEPETSVPQQQSAHQISTSDAEMNTGSEAIISEVDESSKASSSGVESGSGALHVLLDLPQAELRLLCSLLAKEGYVVHSLYSYLFLYVLCSGGKTYYIVFF